MRLAVLVLLLMGVDAASASALPKRPNVVLITIDDLATQFGAYGNDQVVAPNFERLAHRTVRFDRAYSQFPSCNGSRTSMLTGLRPDSTGVLNNEVYFRTLLPEVVTLPQFFRRRGYVTVGIGKNFHDSGGESWHDAQSWDVFHRPHGKREAKEGKGRNVTGGEIPWASWVAAKGKDKDFADGRVAASAVATLENLYAEGEPFFLAVGFQKPHPPFVVPKRHYRRYRPGRLRLHDPPGERSKELPAALGPWPRITRRDRRELLRAYYAAVSFTDRQLGLILDVLDRVEGWNNTVVVLTSDHGFHLGEHDWWGKDTLFEHSVRVPLLVHAPKMERKRKKSSRLVELLDIYPTLVALARLKPPSHLQGRSLVPLLEEPLRHWSRAAFSQASHGGIEGESVRTGRWRYTEWNGGGEGVELYDHSVDPDEYLNLAVLPEYESVIEDLSRLLGSNFED